MKHFLAFVIAFSFSLGAIAEEATADETKLGHESQASVAMTGGNSSAETYQFKQTTTLTFDPSLVRLGAHYLYGRANSLEAAKNWDLSLRYEHSFDKNFSVFAGHGWEGDIFIGYDYRTYVDVGGKYYLTRDDKDTNYLFSELGYRYLYEHRIPSITPDTLTSHMIRAYLEGLIALNEAVSAKAWLELLPDLNNSGNLQLNFEASVSVAMSKVLALKAAYGGRYRQTPVVAGNKNLDTLFSTSLIAKF